MPGRKKRSPFNTNCKSLLAAPLDLDSNIETAGSASSASYGALTESELEGLVQDQEQDLEDEISDFRAIAAKGVW